jgi:ketosteroid isomerase-like protein
MQGITRTCARSSCNPLSRVLVVVLLGLSACTLPASGKSGESSDIVGSSFPDAQAAIKAEMRRVVDAAQRHDWEALRQAHLDSPKFTKFGRGRARENFEEMIASEIAGISTMKDPSVDFRDLRLDVYGDVAVSTSFPLFTWTDESGERVEIEIRSTVIWVKTAHGWKMAHEHNTPLEQPPSPQERN